MYALSPAAPVVALSRRAAARARTAAGLPRRARGGQPGNTNRLIHGRYGRAFLARRAHVRALLRQTRVLLAQLRLAAGVRRVTTLVSRHARSAGTDRPSQPCARPTPPAQEFSTIPARPRPDTVRPIPTSTVHE